MPPIIDPNPMHEPSPEEMLNRVVTMLDVNLADKPIPDLTDPASDYHPRLFIMEMFEPGDPAIPEEIHPWAHGVGVRELEHFPESIWQSFENTAQALIFAGLTWYQARLSRGTAVDNVGMERAVGAIFHADAWSVAVKDDEAEDIGDVLEAMGVPPSKHPDRYNSRITTGINREGDVVTVFRNMDDGTFETKTISRDESKYSRVEFALGVFFVCMAAPLDFVYKQVGQDIQKIIDRFLPGRESLFEDLIRMTHDFENSPMSLESIKDAVEQILDNHNRKNDDEEDEGPNGPIIRA